MEISKSEFEAILSVATSSQMQVYEKVSPAILDATERCETQILGTAGTAAIEKDTSAGLLAAAKRYIAIDAFLSRLHQLDLVLTPTGFGVVSNNTTAPASRDRVTALENELQVQRERTLDKLLTLLPYIDGWGDEKAALLSIRTLYSFSCYEMAMGRATDIAGWREAQRLIDEADMMLRRLVSDEQMDALLSAVRHNNLTTEQLGAVVTIQRINSLHISHAPYERDETRRLLCFIEQNEDAFSEYMNSSAYKTNHYERFQNTKDAAGFCFVG